MFQRKFILILFTLCLLSLLQGCAPAPEPVWLNDSGSFIYTRTDGATVHYSLTRKAGRTLMKPGEYRPARVAVHPVGTMSAIAVAEAGPKGSKVSIQLIRLSNGAIVQSTSKVWGDQNAKRDVQPTSAYWCPTGKRILVCYTQKTDGVNGYKYKLYDVPNNQLKELETAQPAIQMASVLNVSPFLPDGSGYLAMKDGKYLPTFSFVDWKGWEHKLTIEPEAKKVLTILKNSKASVLEKSDTIFPIPMGKWNGNVLECPTQKGLLRFDIKNKKVRLGKLSKSHKTLFQTILKDKRTKVEWMTSKVATFHESDFQLHYIQPYKSESKQVRIDLVDVKHNRRRIFLKDEYSVKDISMFYASPFTRSPDGKKILVSIVQEGDGWIYVVDEKGKIITKVNTGKIKTKGK